MTKRILFQGDSITDALRCRDMEQYRGSGYATLVAAKVGFEHPGEYEFINRGTSGDSVVDMLSRVKRDIINLKPDVMSILVGINGIWHEFDANDGVDEDVFKGCYRLLIEQIKKELPDIRILILEPFVLKGEATEEYWEPFRAETEKRAKILKSLSEEYELDFIPLMKKFDEACELAPPSYWLMDGVHPTAAGHELIAREWIATFEK